MSVSDDRLDGVKTPDKMGTRCLDKKGQEEARDADMRWGWDPGQDGHEGPGLGGSILPMGSMGGLSDMHACSGLTAVWVESVSGWESGLMM